MVVAYIEERGFELPEDADIGSDDGGLVPVASRQVLTGDDGDLRHLSGGIALQQDEFGMIVGQIEPVDSLNEERPQTERLVGGFVIQD